MWPNTRHMHGCGRFSRLIIQDIITLSTHVVQFFHLPRQQLDRMWRSDAMPYSSLCMGNIYWSNITEIYAALFISFRMSVLHEAYSFLSHTIDEMAINMGVIPRGLKKKQKTKHLVILIADFQSCDE